MSRQVTAFSEIGELRRFTLSLQKLLLVAIHRLNELERKLKRSGGVAFSKYTDAEAIAAVEGEPTLDLSGAVTVGGNVDVGANRLQTSNLSFVEVDSQTMALYGKSDVATKDLNVDELDAETNVTTLSLKPRQQLLKIMSDADGEEIWIQSYETTLKTVAKILSGCMNILRAGDITFLANKKLFVGNISATGTVATQTKYFTVDDGGVTRYIPMYDSVS